MSIIRPNLGGGRLYIGVIQVRFTSEIGNKMLEVCCCALKEPGVADENITAATVPGALEMLPVLQNMVVSNQHDALVVVGVVVRGGTYHFELVSSESGAGVTHVGLDHNIPAANAILTTENDDQAATRIEERASSAARVAAGCVNLVNLLLEE